MITFVAVELTIWKNIIPLEEYFSIDISHGTKETAAEKRKNYAAMFTKYHQVGGNLGMAV